MYLGCGYSLIHPHKCYSIIYLSLIKYNNFVGFVKLHVKKKNQYCYLLFIYNLNKEKHWTNLKAIFFVNIRHSSVFFYIICIGTKSLLLTKKIIYLIKKINFVTINITAYSCPINTEFITIFFTVITTIKPQQLSPRPQYL